MEEIYNDFSRWIRNKFPYRVQKLSIDGGFSCPNRDGKLSRGGCSYCDNRTFNPSYCDRRRSIAEQIAEGKQFFSRKYPDMKYLAYFQAFSNTYAPVDKLRKLYEEALAQDDVVGLVVGTRPDCVAADVMDLLQELSRQTFLILEFGIESTNDTTLRLINRGHDFDCSRRAVEEAHRRGIITGGHVILGLPGETPEESVRQAGDISALPLDILKIHQMQVVRGTRLAQQYEEEPFHVYDVDEYIRLVADYIEHLRPSLVLERFVSQSPAEMLIAPRWGLKNYEFTARLRRYMLDHGMKQGRKA
ncbi:MAG: TIGR01212 family radical SAM protein [Prevotella sp.]|nr:TIGR01212 family radical SAM protein [Prevotella sp.]